MVSRDMMNAQDGAMDAAEFQQQLGDCLDRLRPVFIARHGLDVAGDLHAEVTNYAWEHRDRLASMDNPTGYLFRVSQSKVRRYQRWRRRVSLPPERLIADVGSSADLGLDEALARLSIDERTVVVLVHAYGNSYREVADLLGISHAAVRSRLHRGMTRLRLELGET
jgi:RNA polymerase sigma factor (sigma-70 family)